MPRTAFSLVSIVKAAFALSAYSARKRFFRAESWIRLPNLRAALSELLFVGTTAKISYSKNEKASESLGG